MTTFIRATVAAGSMAAAAALLVPATASADTGPKLIETTCTFAQIDAATHAKFPAFAARLDANPDRKAKVQAFFNLPVDQRKQRAAKFLEAHPKIKAKVEERPGTPQAQKRRANARVIAESCSKF